MPVIMNVIYPAGDTVRQAEIEINADTAVLLAEIIAEGVEEYLFTARDEDERSNLEKISEIETALRTAIDKTLIPPT